MAISIHCQWWSGRVSHEASDNFPADFLSTEPLFGSTGKNGQRPRRQQPGRSIGPIASASQILTEQYAQGYVSIYILGPDDAFESSSAPVSLVTAPHPQRMARYAT